MKKVFHKNNWDQGAVQLHVGPPLILLIKSNNSYKFDEDYVLVKLRRDPMLEKSDLYEFIMVFFITESRRVSYCSLVIFKLISRRQEHSLLARRFSIFVR